MAVGKSVNGMSNYLLTGGGREREGREELRKKKEGVNVEREKEHGNERDCSLPSLPSE